MSEGAQPRELNPGDRIGRYQIVRPLGRGGMGVVYVARDDRLDRDVALKTIAGLADDTARTRFWREARAAASVSHPHVCQVFEVDESGGGIFLTMELLEGEPLDKRLARGALPPREAMPIALGVLSALEALHARGLVHRDIKPSNVFVTTHGPKLLDFGLARAVIQPAVAAGSDATPVTAAGMIIGTPHYMAPEQVTGAAVDGRTDLYSAGAVIFQMLAGRPPFTGSAGDVLFAALKEHPPALQGPSDVIAIDRVIRRAMRKDPADRYGSATAMAADLAAISLSSGGAAAIPVHALTRIVVPPLRMPMTDADVAYLSFGLAEAMSASLATIGNVVVRSPVVAAKWNDEATDPRRLAADIDVDLIVSSTLRRSGSQLRVTAQLIDAPSGTVIGAQTVQGTVDDVFALEDALTHAAATLLTPRLSPTAAIAEQGRVRRDVPANPRAFELFLRGMEEARSLTATAKARELFQQAVAEDPNFAPAWAALGRAHRVWGKFYADRDDSDRLAEEAFKRALELSPDLPLAHRYLTHFESEHGRAADAIARLLRHASSNRHDAQLFAGLVHACRYAGLLDASLAAHQEALRLDPTVATGVEYTIAHLHSGPEKAALLTSPRSGSLDGIFPAMAVGTPAAARSLLDAVDMSRVPPAYQRSFEAIIAFAQGDAAQTIKAVDRAICVHVDPEALFLFGLMLSRIGAHERGLEIVTTAVAAGYTPVAALRHNDAFDAVRSLPAFAWIEETARVRMKSAERVFEAAGGPELLGMPAATRLSN